MPDKTWIAFEISIMGWRGMRQIVAARNRDALMAIGAVAG